MKDKEQYKNNNENSKHYDDTKFNQSITTDNITVKLSRQKKYNEIPYSHKSKNKDLGTTFAKTYYY